MIAPDSLWTSDAPPRLIPTDQRQTTTHNSALLLASLLVGTSGRLRDEPATKDQGYVGRMALPAKITWPMLALAGNDLSSLVVAVSCCFHVELRIRVIGWVDPADLAAASPSSLPAGSVQTLSLDDLLQSSYTDSYCNEQQPLWIQVENASGKDLERIGAHFGLHPLTVEAVQTRHTREKLEIFQNYLFLVFHALHAGMQMGGGAEYTARDRGRDTRQRPEDGTFAAAATSLMDPYGIARGLAGEKSGPPPSDRPLEHVHEGSALLTGNDKVSAKYYGADPAMSHSIHPSPAPPRRHKSALSLPTGQPSMSPSASYGNRAGGLTAAGGAVTPSSSSASASASAAASSSSSSFAAAAALPPELLSVGVPPTSPSPADLSDRFRYFPEQVLMPGSPQSVSSYDSTPAHTDDSDSSDDSDDSRSDAASAASEQSSRTSPTSRATNQHILAREMAQTLTGGNQLDSADAATAVAARSAPTAASLLTDREPLRTAPIKLVVFPHIVLSFHSSGLETVASVARRLDRVYASNVESTAWIIHALLDSITDSLLPVVNGTAMEVDALEELIYVLSGSEHRDLLKRMGMTRRRLSFLRQRLWSKRDILMSLIGKVREREREQAHESNDSGRVCMVAGVLNLRACVCVSLAVCRCCVLCAGLANVPCRRSDPVFARCVRSRGDDVAQGGGGQRHAGRAAEHLPGERADRRGGGE